jgi:5-methylcytosine-specific restriction endonuclease McrA
MGGYSKEHYQANRERLLAASKRWREKNREYNLARQRRWRAENHDRATRYAAEYARRNKDVVRERRRAHWVANADRLRAQGRAWKQRNRARANELSRNWYWNNRDRAIATAKLNNLKRIAREQGAAGAATLDQIMSRVAFYGHRCYLCRAPYEAVDHVKPIARGGSNWPANLRPICKPCNSRKRCKWPFAPAVRRVR